MPRYYRPNVFRGTWASRPSPTSVPVGSEFTATDYANQKWINDGTYWRPAQGRVLIYSRSARNLGTPISTLSANGVFAIPGGGALIPAGMIPPNSKVCCCTQLRKFGTAGAVESRIRIGTTGNVTDAYMAGGRLSNIDNCDIKIVGHVSFGDVTNAGISAGSQPENTGTVGGVSFDATTNVDTQSDMRVTPLVITLSSPDVVSLLFHQVWLEG